MKKITPGYLSPLGTIARFLFIIFFLNGCASHSVRNTDNQAVFVTQHMQDALLETFAPVFIVDNGHIDYNLIGTPSAQFNEDGSEKIFIDPSKATIYTEIRPFSTSKNTYKNLIYRVHFKETPGGYFPYYLTKGKNVGHIVLVTLNEKNEPLLYTSVHSCGCYLAFIPTSHMDKNQRPKDWPLNGQNAFGEHLPSLLQFDELNPKETKVAFTLRHATHRVRDIQLINNNKLQQSSVMMHQQPLTALHKIPVSHSETTSFFETSGSGTGYVKGSSKPRERLLMSWWALDWRIGEDKKLGNSTDNGAVFYTSLKPWARKQSDLRDFPAFLNYWGWDL